MPVVKSQVPATSDAEGLTAALSCHPDPQGPATRPDEARSHASWSPPPPGDGHDQHPDPGSSQSIVSASCVAATGRLAITCVGTTRPSTPTRVTPFVAAADARVVAQIVASRAPSATQMSARFAHATRRPQMSLPLAGRCFSALVRIGCGC
jgi:hypothetical protein